MKFLCYMLFGLRAFMSLCLAQHTSLIKVLELSVKEYTTAALTTPTLAPVASLQSHKFQRRTISSNSASTITSRSYPHTSFDTLSLSSVQPVTSLHSLNTNTPPVNNITGHTYSTATQKNGLSSTLPASSTRNSNSSTDTSKDLAYSRASVSGRSSVGTGNLGYWNTSTFISQSRSTSFTESSNLVSTSVIGKVILPSPTLAGSTTSLQSLQSSFISSNFRESPSGLSGKLSSTFTVILPISTTLNKLQSNESIAQSTLSKSSPSSLTLSTYTPTISPPSSPTELPTVTTGTASEAPLKTSESLQLGSLLMWLQTNRRWFADPTSKHRYLDHARKSHEQTLALLTKLDVKAPRIPDCLHSKRKRFLRHRRGIISSIGSFIKGAAHDVVKLVSCAVDVSNNLVKAVEKSTPDLDEIENLIDTIGEIGRLLKIEGENGAKHSGSPKESTSAKSSTSCTTSRTITNCQVSCTLTSTHPGRRRAEITGRSCSTTCSATTGGCNAIATTSITTVGSTPTPVWGCSSENPLCAPNILNDPPSGLPPCNGCVRDSDGFNYIAAKGATRETTRTILNLSRSLRDVSTGIKKRMLPNPENFGNNVGSFLVQQLLVATFVQHGSVGQHIVVDRSAPAVITRPLEKKRVVLGATNIYGCTVVIVTSKRGVWMSHFWEIPSFVNQTGPTGVFDSTRFKRDVLDTLDFGCVFDGADTSRPSGLRCYAEMNGWFIEEHEPEIVVITPRLWGQPREDVLDYPDQTRQIVSKVRQILPYAKEPRVVGYVRNGPDGLTVWPGGPATDWRGVPWSGGNPFGFSWPQGKVLFQYDPAHVLRNTDHCPIPIAESVSEVWVEDRTSPVLRKEWIAEPGIQDDRERLEIIELAPGVSKSAGTPPQPLSSLLPSVRFRHRRNTADVCSVRVSTIHSTTTGSVVVPKSTTPRKDAGTTTSISNSTSAPPLLISSPSQSLTSSQIATSPVSRSPTALASFITSISVVSLRSTPSSTSTNSIKFSTLVQITSNPSSPSPPAITSVPPVATPEKPLTPGALPKLSKSCVTSTLVNCKFIFKPVGPGLPCPTVTEILPATCGGITTPTPQAVPSQAAPSAPASLYQKGTCRIHIYYQTSISVNAPFLAFLSVFDGGNNLLSSKEFPSNKWGDKNSVAAKDTKLPYDVEVHFEGAKRWRAKRNALAQIGQNPPIISLPFYMEYPVTIRAGDKTWSFKDTDQNRIPYCKVGKWGGLLYGNGDPKDPTRDADCHWAC